MTLTQNELYALIVAAVLIVALIAVAAWASAQRRRKESLRLQQRFGPEYVRLVNERGRSKAEAELAEREKRVASLTLVSLSAAEAATFRDAWVAIQARFVDDPKASVVEADRLVYDLMAKRGYPMGDFERRAADISVDHPAVIANYRAARAIALRDERNEASTEELRKAVVHYRALFQELLETRDPQPQVIARRPVSVS
jgi:FtsZ-interacting cell division protein ZipA